MKIAPAQTDSFVRAPKPGTRVVLLFGPDAGLVSERAKTIALTVSNVLDDPFRVSLLTGEQVAKTPSLLHDEMAAQAFGGGRRLVRLTDTVESCAPSLAALVEEMPDCDSLLLIEAGDLDKKSKIRALCEKADASVAAIPCYVEDAPARQRVTESILKAEGLSINRDLLVLLAEQLPPDRIAMRSEIDKLCLYMQSAPSKKVELEDIEATITNAGAAEIEALVQSTASGNVKETERLLHALYAEQTSAVAILRALQNHFLRLQKGRAQMATGLSAREVVDGMQPKIFWKYVTPMTNQLQRWSLPRLQKALVRLNDAEAATKRTGQPAETLTAQLLLSLSAL